MIYNSLNISTLRTVLNEVGAYIYIKNLEGEYIYANNLVLKLFSIDIHTLIGKDDHYFFKDEKLEALLENDKKVLSGQTIRNEESLIVKKTNEKKYFVVVKKPLFDEKGKICGLFGISTDITKQKKLEYKILEQKQFLYTILDNVDAYIYLKDKNRVYKYVNSKVAKLFGLPAKQIIGKVDSQIISKNIADSFWQSDLEVLKTKKRVALEEKYEDENKVFYYWSVKIPYLDNILGFSTDITALKEKEIEIKQKDEILNHQSKLAAMGEMIENIAHQWRQPLSTISTAVSGIKLQDEMGILKKNEMHSSLDTVLQNTKILSQTIEDFKNFFKSNKEKINFNIEETLEKVLTLLSSILKNKSIKLIKNIDTCTLYGLENELTQALLNIFTNAKDALQESEEEKFIFIDITHDQNRVYIKISDNGAGIKEDIIDKIFEPYFTTKFKSQGTGIGLYMTRTIIVNHMQGQLNAKNIEFEYLNKKYKGAQFEIILDKQMN